MRFYNFIYVEFILSSLGIEITLYNDDIDFVKLISVEINLLLNLGQSFFMIENNSMRRKTFLVYLIYDSNGDD